MARILMIDASHRNRTQVERILRLRTEHTIVLAEDGADAIEHLREGLPDIILMDLFLPRVDGFHVYRVLKERPATARIPIILSTSVNLDPVTEARVKQLQVEGRVEMPVSSSELVEVISLALMRQQAAQAIRKEKIQGAPQEVARVSWPRVDRPAPPSEPPPAANKPVKPVSWPKAGSREDQRQEADKEGEAEAPLGQTKLSGRDHRARLAMLASGQIPAETPTPPKAKGGKRDSRPFDSAQDRPATQDVPDPTYADRVQALLRHVGKPDAPSKPGEFQGLPVAKADPARVIDFTRKARAVEGAEGGEAKSGKTETPKLRKPSEKGAGEDDKGPVVRPVQWTQIKKDSET